MSGTKIVGRNNLPHNSSAIFPVNVALPTYNSFRNDHVSLIIFSLVANGLENFQEFSDVAMIHRQIPCVPLLVLEWCTNPSGKLFHLLSFFLSILAIQICNLASDSRSTAFRVDTAKFWKLLGKTRPHAGRSIPPSIRARVRIVDSGELWTDDIVYSHFCGGLVLFSDLYHED